LEVTTSVVSSSFATTSGSLSSRVTIIEGQDATTGSNTFTGVQYISQASNAISFTSTASLYTDGGLRVAKDSFISGTAYFNNIIVYGTSSIQYITSSQVNVGTNIITVNTDTPAVRFGGLAVFDSGSTQLTGSIFWDSEKNHWVYSNPSGSSYSGGMLMSGPRSSALGDEQGTLNNYVMKGQGGDHITSSQIIDDGTTVRIPGAFQVTGSTILASALSGTSATFSGNLLVGPTTSGFDSVSQIASSSTGNIISALTLQNTSLTETAGTGVNLNFGGRLNWLGRISTQFVGTTGGGDASMSFSTPSGGNLGVRLTIASTGDATFTNTETTFNFNPQTSLLSGYRYLNFGGSSIMYRAGTDMYFGSNAKYGSAGTILAAYTSANGMGMLSLDGGALRWQGLNASVTAGTAYSVPTRFYITPDGYVGIGTGSGPATFLHVLGTNTSARGQLSIQSNNSSNAAKATWYYDTFNSGEIGTTSSDFYALATNNLLLYAGGSPRMTITSGGGINTNNNTIYSAFIQPGNINNGASYTYTYQQTSAEYQVVFEYCIVGLYAPSGVNLNGITLGYAAFFADGSTNSAYNSLLIQNGWSISVSATNAGAFNITFTNGGGATMSNVNIRVRKVNRTNAG
jgi:hypothetical protein